MRALPLLILLVCASCGGIQRDYPEKRAYAVDVTRPGEARAGGSGTLLVRRTAASDAWDSRAFVHRFAGGRVEADYYNEHFSPPAETVGDELLEWLSASGVFAAVVAEDSAQLPTHVLETRLVGIYAEHAPNRAAVLEVQAFLLDYTSSPAAILLQETYVERTPLEDDGAPTLVAGWQAVLTRVLARLERDLASAR